ncbi:hypothetical protein GCM10010211_40560 [Streptomyces albospinus]|uniref:Secreted protein n=2 Tax=Streptomyces albospinus TaxID=285515 RepID=A0ABQ2V7V1_9ACTN|nr:hypothetical protein GCM10010211_40560 [Streptomyces albospinus]
MVCAGAALAAATAAPASAATGPPARARVAVIDCTGNAQVRPGQFMLACGDGNNVLTSLRWSQWQPQAAVAEGTDMVNDCKPYCAAGRFHGYPVHVRLQHPQLRSGHPGQWHFTQATLTYHGSRPADTAAVVTSRLWG